MTPHSFFTALANHLWQSTLFALTVWLLTLLLRHNQARARYGLWLAASLKFLLPFSLLVSLGGRLASPRPPADSQTGFYWAIEQMKPVSQPFTPQRLSLAPPAAVAPSPSLDLLPSLLGATWLCGLIAVLLVWLTRWRRISAVVREAAPLHAAREVKALRRLESKAGMKPPLEMRLSPASLEPGIFGIWRPVLLWPEGISQRLGDEHLDAILAHELGHVRRRDNLAAAMHMVVSRILRLPVRLDQWLPLPAQRGVRPNGRNRSPD
jgi:bla regulator protein BlaR1